MSIWSKDRKRPTLDITDMEAIRKMVEENDVQAIINCAAWTNVDACETDEN